MYTSPESELQRNGIRYNPRFVLSKNNNLGRLLMLILWILFTVCNAFATQNINCILLNKDTTVLKDLLRSKEIDSTTLQIYKLHLLHLQNKRIQFNKEYSNLSSLDSKIKSDIHLRYTYAINLLGENNIKEAERHFKSIVIHYDSVSVPVILCEKQFHLNSYYGAILRFGMCLRLQSAYGEAQDFYKNKLKIIPPSHKYYDYISYAHCSVLVSQEKVGEALIHLDSLSNILENKEPKNYVLLNNTYYAMTQCFSLMQLGHQISEITDKMHQIPAANRDSMLFLHVASFDEFHQYEISRDDVHLITLDSLLNMKLKVCTSTGDSCVSYIEKIFAAKDKSDLSERYNKGMKCAKQIEFERGVYLCEDLMAWKMNDLGLIDSSYIKKLMKIFVKNCTDLKLPQQYIHKVLLEHNKNWTPTMPQNKFVQIYDSIQNIRNIQKNLYIQHISKFANKNPKSQVPFVMGTIFVLTIILILILSHHKRSTITPTTLDTYYRSVCHDMKFPLEKLEYLISTNQPDQAIESLNDIQFTLTNLIQLFELQETAIVDSTMNTQMTADLSIANLIHPKKEKAQFNIELNHNHKTNGNLIYHVFINAFHNALRHSQINNPKIYVNDYIIGDYSYINIQNQTEELHNTSELNSKFLDANSKNAGFGLQIIKSIVTHLHGSAKFITPTKGYDVNLSIRLPL